MTAGGHSWMVLRGVQIRGEETLPFLSSRVAIERAISLFWVSKYLKSKLDRVKNLGLPRKRNHELAMTPFSSPRQSLSRGPQYWKTKEKAKTWIPDKRFREWQKSTIRGRCPLITPERWKQKHKDKRKRSKIIRRKSTLFVTPECFYQGSTVLKAFDASLNFRHDEKGVIPECLKLLKNKSLRRNKKYPSVGMTPNLLPNVTGFQILSDLGALWDTIIPAFLLLSQSISSSPNK